jgi:hypothetical protein
MQLEVVTTFTFKTGSKPWEFGVDVLVGPTGSEGVSIFVNCGCPSNGLNCTAGVTPACGGWIHDPCYCHLGTGPATDPMQTVRLHAIVDHSSIEAIFNNRSAMATYTPWANLPSAESAGVRLYGNASRVKGSLQTWQLDDA